MFVCLSGGTSPSIKAGSIKAKDMPRTFMFWWHSRTVFKGYFVFGIRDRLLIPQVLIFSVQENRGKGVDTSENFILEEKRGRREGAKTKKLE